MTLIPLKAKTTQEFIPIKEIREGTVILENGSMLMILMCSSLNFALKSSDEQEAIIMQFQDFLNSLDFSIQFFIESRRLNIEPYLDTLKLAKEKQVNELLRIQIEEYIEFIRNFVTMTEIVSKTFYVAIPFIPSILPTKALGTIGGILGKFLSQKPTRKKEEEGDRFEEYKTQLTQRAAAVSQGLTRCGIRAVPLETDELIELFFKLYNPGELTKGQIPKI